MTFWIDPVSGSDSNNGQAAVLGGGNGPKRTLQGGLGLLTTGDTLNIINSGALQVTQTTNLPAGCTGTSFTSFGALIRGTDVNGNPAMATLTFDNTATARTAVGVRSGNQYIILRGLKIDRSVNTIGAIAKNLLVVNDNSNSNNAGPVLIEACISIDKVSTAVVGSVVSITPSTGVVPTQIEVRYCLFTNQGSTAFVNVTGESRRPVLFHHNVIILESGGTSTGQVSFGANDNDADVDHEYYNNTILIRSGRISNVSSVSTLATGVNAAARKKFHSNVWANYSSTVGTDSVFTGSSTWEDTTWPGLRTIGNNVFIDGIDGGTFRWATNQPYQVPWDFDLSDTPDPAGQLWDTDVSTTADPFNDRNTPWDWENVNGTGYTIPLSGDLRLLAHRTAGLNGAVPGAIQESVIPPSEPPIWVPGPGGLPVGPDAPVFLSLDDRSPGVSSLKLNRNTVLRIEQHVDSQLEQITHIVDGMAFAVTNTANAGIVILPATRLFMMETDARLTVQINSHTFLLQPGGCFMVNGASLSTFKVSNLSTVKPAILKFIGGN